MTRFGVIPEVHAHTFDYLIRQFLALLLAKSEYSSVAALASLVELFGMGMDRDILMERLIAFTRVHVPEAFETAVRMRSFFSQVSESPEPATVAEFDDLYGDLHARLTRLSEAAPFHPVLNTAQRVAREALAPVRLSQLAH